MTAEPWPDRRTAAPKSPAVGDVVELERGRYRIVALHPTDEGPLVQVQPILTLGSTFIQAHELRWDGSLWRQATPETEGELREAFGR